MGRCLHEIIEELPYALFPIEDQGHDHPRSHRSRRRSVDLDLPSPSSFDEWIAHPVVINIFESVMRRHGISSQWAALCQRLIYATLNHEISTPPKSAAPPRLPPLCRTRHIIEMEFLFPIPERDHPSLESSAMALAKVPRGEKASHLTSKERLPWRVEKGFIKGFIDFIFEVDGLIYFADWKSDLLLNYTGNDFIVYIEDHYLLQAQLYTLGVIRWLKITNEREYNQRFGGLFYFFLRAFVDQGDDGRGVFFKRPSWSEVCSYERELGLLMSSP